MLEISGWDAAGVVMKAIVYATTLGAAGSVFFLGYARPLPPSAAQRIRTLVASLCIIGIAASVVRVLVLSSSMSGDLAGAFDIGASQMILRAGEGRATGMRLAGLVIVLATIRGPSRWPSASLLGAAVAATSFASIGHVYALRSLAPRLVLCVHLLGVAFWFGALAPLLIATRHAPGPDAAALVERFGRIATGVVVLLLAAGTVLLCTLLVGVSDLWSGDYGLWVTLKLVLVGVMLGLAADNKLRLTPALAHCGFSATRRLRRSIKLELALGCLVLLATAALTSLTGPPR